MIKQSRPKREQNEGFLAKGQMKASGQTYFLLLLHKCFLPFSQAQDGRHLFLLFLNFVLFPFFTGSQLNKKERLEIRIKKKHENLQFEILVHRRITGIVKNKNDFFKILSKSLENAKQTQD